jgi:hypothetical protein
MARVLVVNRHPGRAGPAAAAARGLGPAGRQIRRSQDLDDCDLLVIRDTPALQRGRRSVCSVRDCSAGSKTCGQLRDGDGHRDVLDDGAIGRALRRMQLAVEPWPCTHPRSLADGAHAITRLLRERLPLRQGQALLVMRASLR